MQQAALSPFIAWGNFYVIIGSASAALTGLQFVVIVLSAQLNRLGANSSVGAFGTPTIVHFCAVLLISAMLSAPWPALASVGLMLGACGVTGLVYAVMVIRKARQQTSYVPVLEDWIWHGALPLIAYVALFVAAVLLQGDPATSLFVVGGTALLLLFIGIHNAWDSAVYIATHQRQHSEQPRRQDADSDERAHQPEC